MGESAQHLRGSHGHPAEQQQAQARAVARLEADIEQAVAEERDRLACADRALLVQVDADPDAIVTKGELMALARRAVAEARRALPTFDLTWSPR